MKVLTGHRSIDNWTTPARMLTAMLSTVCALVASTSGVAFAGPAAASVAGRITEESGSALAAAKVILSTDWSSSTHQHQYVTFTDAKGRYRFHDVAPGTGYVVAFDLPGSTLRQLVPRTRTLQWATAYTIAAHSHLVVDDVALPFTTITGSFTDTAGAPVRAEVMAMYQGSHYVNDEAVRTDDAGRYTIRAMPGSYLIRFHFGTDSSQYFPGVLTVNQATRMGGPGGAHVIVNDVMVATGALAGRVTVPDGAPAVNASVQLSATTSYGAIALHTTASSDGTYRFELVPSGSYQVQYQDAAGEQSQWADGAIDASTASYVTVVTGQAATLDQTFLPAGALVIRPTATGTGIPDRICVDLYHGGQTLRSFVCSDDATLEFRSVTAADGYQMRVYAMGDPPRQADLTDITVAAGVTTTLEYAFQPDAADQLAVDRVTGANPSRPAA